MVGKVLMALYQPPMTYRMVCVDKRSCFGDVFLYGITIFLLYKIRASTRRTLL